MSLGHWALWAWEKAGGDSITEIWAGFAGNWQEVSKSGDALANLSAFCDAAAGEIRAEVSKLESAWDGLAAREAIDYFKSVADKLEEQKSNFDDTATEFQQFAQGVKEIGISIGSGIEFLIDMVIAIGVTAAATAATAWTGVGAVVGGGAMAAEIVTAAAQVYKIAQIWGQVWPLCTAALGVIMTLANSFQDFSSVKLPDPYAGV